MIRSIRRDAGPVEEMAPCLHARHSLSVPPQGLAARATAHLQVPGFLGDDARRRGIAFRENQSGVISQLCAHVAALERALFGRGRECNSRAAS